MKQSKPLGLDADGIQKTMHRNDYVADMLGQFALGVMDNIVGQLSYFYTDKVGVAVGSVGIALGAAKVGVGIGTALLSLFLFLGHYDADLAVATSSMKMAIYGFTNYLPIVINLLLFLN